MRIAAILAVGATFAPAAPAQAQISSVWDAEMTAEGQPRFGVRGVGPGTVVTVHRCPGGGDCGAPIGSAAGWSSIEWADMTGVEPGDVFEVRHAQGDQVTFSARTPAWRGTPTLAEPPKVSGELVVGERVHASAGRWSDAGWAPGWPGKWRNDVSTGHFVCASADGRDCDYAPASADFELQPEWAGRYLFTTSDISFWNGWVAAIALREPPFDLGSGSGPMGARSAPFGPIRAKTSVTVRERALRRDGRISVGRVTCLPRCDVMVKVSGGGRPAYRTAFVATGTKAISAPSRRGTLRVRVHVDGRLERVARVVSR